jgi:hypothetical protein
MLDPGSGIVSSNSVPSVNGFGLTLRPPLPSLFAMLVSEVTTVIATARASTIFPVKRLRLGICVGLVVRLIDNAR